MNDVRGSPCPLPIYKTVPLQTNYSLSTMTSKDRYQRARNLPTISGLVSHLLNSKSEVYTRISLIATNFTSHCPCVHYCQQCLLLLILPFQVSEIKRAHVRGLLHAFKVPTQSILHTQQQANEQASKYYQHGKIQIHSRTRPNEVVVVVCAVSSVQSMLVTVPLFNNLYIKY